MPMKVTVCFDNVRVIVPCGDGEILVQELISKAITRYKKATGKSSNHWILVHNLKTISGGGILDPDDQLSDVVDDREQLIAIFEEQGRVPGHHNGGDGASASSTGTASPDMFQSGESTHSSSVTNSYSSNGKTDVVVTPRDLTLGSTLIVRRGSEPALNTIGKKPIQNGTSNLVVGKEDSRERKGPVGSCAIEEEKEKKEIGDDMIVLVNDGGPLGIHVIPDYDDNGRDMGLMIQGIEKGGKVFKDGRLKEEDKIIEINGQSLLQESFKRAQEIFREAMKSKELRLKVKKAVPPLPSQPPPVLPKPKGHSPIKPSPLTLSPKVSNSPEEDETMSGNTSPVVNNNKTVKPKYLPLNRDTMPIKAAPPLKPGSIPPVESPTKRTPPAVPVRHPSTSLTHENKESSAFTAITNTRKIGKKIKIELKKGELGLGFSITSRDNMTGGEIPIYIKNILPRGAAIADGRLKPGDRLLEVNGEEMTGKNQPEAVAYLRKIPKNSVAELVVSRQETVEGDEEGETKQSTSTEEVSPDDKENKTKSVENITAVEEPVTPNQQNKNKEVLLLDIPLNDTGSTGLGVSVKGKSISTPQGSKDLGIFIKSVMPGGAADKDGRLAVDDQMLEINGVKLVGLSNHKAMEQLRNAMQKDGPIKGTTFLTVSRKTGSVSPVVVGEHTDVTDSAEYVMMHGSSESKGANSQEQQYADRNTKPNNPLLNRLMANTGSGGVTGQGLRNESYTRATQDSFFNDSTSSMDNAIPSPFGKLKTFKSPTVNPSSREEVIIENDTYSLPKKNQARPRPHSTIGLPIKSYDETTSSNEDLHKPVQKHRQTNSLDDGNQQDSDLSPDGDHAGFSREGFGRQSMSEKRKGHIDPRNTEFFWRARSGREQRTGHARSISNTSSIAGNIPSSNLKRSTSLEDLSQPLPSLDDQQSGSGSGSMAGHSINRPRACNESFRAAVDRSYESQFNQQNPSMDTLEEESFDSEAFSHGHSGNSTRSSLSSENTADEHGFKNKRKTNKEKKTGGILKGFLRFGKGRKSNEEDKLRSKSAERPTNDEVDLHQFQREQAWQIAQNEKQRQDLRRQQQHQQTQLQQQQQSIGNHRTRQQEQQTAQPQHYGEKQQQQQYPDQQHSVYSNKHSQDPYYRSAQDHYSSSKLDMYGGKQQDFYGVKQDYYKNYGPVNPQVQFNSLPRPSTKTEKIQQLRAEHRRRHQERDGHYPMDEAEEYYERKLLEEERMRYNRSGSESHTVYARPASRGALLDRSGNIQGSINMVSATNYSPHPSLSDESEYSHSSVPSRGHPSSTSHLPSQQHHQHRSGFPGYTEQIYRQHVHDGGRSVSNKQFIPDASTQKKPWYYNEPSHNYRDPNYPVYNGRRMPDPGSAKV